MKTIKVNPILQALINRAVFINQDLVVFPQGRMPDNLSEVAKFLFDEGTVVTQDRVDDHACIRITGASYVLNNVKTLDAEYTCRMI